MLCILIVTKSLLQESYDYCKKVVLIEIRTQLESLFVVQSIPPSEGMEDASRGYGLLLHAFGLRTEEIRAKYSAKIKEKVSFHVIYVQTSCTGLKKMYEQPRDDLLRLSIHQGS